MIDNNESGTVPDDASPLRCARNNVMFVIMSRRTHQPNKLF